MKITKKDKDRLDLAFNESKINHLEIKPNVIEVLMDCVSMNSENKFPEDDRHKFIFNQFGRIAIRLKLKKHGNDKAEIIKIKANELKAKFDGLKLESMYGWEYINLADEHFNHWQDELSLDEINNNSWAKMNTIDLFAEQIGKETITIDIRIWFTNFKVFDYLGRELSKKEFVENAQRGWNQIYKTGTSSENHKTKTLKK